MQRQLLKNLLQLLALLLLPACTPRPREAPLVWQTALPGLEYALATVPTGQDAQPVTIHLIRLVPRQWQLRVVTPAQMGKPLGSPSDFRATLPHSVAAINAGFFDPDFKPLGLLVDNGQQISPLRHVDHGVFAIVAGQPVLRHAREWQKPEALEFAVECGPRLVVEGQPLTFKPGTARRTVLARDGQGRVLLVVTEGVMGLADLAKFLTQRQYQGGPAVTDALNLDGGPSTMLELEAGKLRARVATPVQVPVGIVVTPRQQ